MMKIEKQVKFNLERREVDRRTEVDRREPSDQDQVTLPQLMSQGYVRKHITVLFEKLEEAGFGQYIKGKQGRGQSAKFIKNENCPKEYLLVLEEKPRGRPPKAVDSVVVKAIAEKEKQDAVEDVAEEVNLNEEEDLTNVVSTLSMVRNDNVILEVEENDDVKNDVETEDLKDIEL